MESGEFVGAGERRGTAECLVRKIRDGGQDESGQIHGRYGHIHLRHIII
jgi:hypothetical protein